MENIFINYKKYINYKFILKLKYNKIIIISKNLFK